MTGLTPAQVVARRKGIGGSDAGAVVAGDWRTLWEVKTGRKPPPDLSRVLPVRLGTATEEFNARWYAQMTGHAVTERGRHVVSAAHPFMRCNLDGVVADIAAVWEGKHVGAGSKIAAVVARYLPQLQHQMIVRRLSRAVLSVIIGTDGYAAPVVAADEAFAVAYVARCADFWHYVETDTRPLAVAPMKIAAAKYAPAEASAPPSPHEMRRHRIGSGGIR